MENPLRRLSERSLETVPSAKCAVHASRDWQSFAKSKLDSLTKPPGSLGRLEPEVRVLQHRSQKLLVHFPFARDFSRAVEQTLARGGGLSVARFAFDPGNPRAQLDAARILSRLMRQMDFGAAQKDGSVIVVRRY